MDPEDGRAFDPAWPHGIEQWLEHPNSLPIAPDGGHFSAKSVHWLGFDNFVTS
jgi:hypothetical protein